MRPDMTDPHMTEPDMTDENAIPPGPLGGILVIDLTRVLAGPYCTLVMAELGARVIKVERPGYGDDAREVGPFIGGKSAYFMSLNRGKESIVLDLGSADDRPIFEKLLARADVLVENYRPGVLAKHGYGWDTLHARWPKLVLASISGFGQTGPYASRPAFDMVVQAMGGVMSLTGWPGGPPTRVGTDVYRQWQDAVRNYRGQNHDGTPPKQGAIWLTYYPGVMLEVYPHVLVVSTLVPQGPRKTLNVVEFYYPEEIVAFEREYVETQQAAYLETCVEDDEIALRMDAGRQALRERGDDDAGPYQSPMEDGMQHFHEWYRRVMGEGTAPTRTGN